MLALLATSLVGRASPLVLTNFIDGHSLHLSYVEKFEVIAATPLQAKAELQEMKAFSLWKAHTPTNPRVRSLDANLKALVRPTRKTLWKLAKTLRHLALAKPCVAGRELERLLGHITSFL